MSSQDGISVRSMRLKVLYTFDSESKTTCLARWPHLLDIQTAYLDDETQIGVIELKTCIQAIVSASPELVAKLGRDYTIYAYDYSEYETPLVGQGMLSWVLASASPTPDAPAHQSKTIVTGRVCRNVLGLFNKGAQETLEVKLRLVPVPTILQSEYLESMQKYRDLSNVIPEDFDAQAWTNFIQANPGILTANTTQQSQDQASSPVECSGIERLHQLLSESSTPREFPNFQTADSYRANSPALSHAGSSRAPTPALGRSLSQQQKRSSGDAFRPASRASSYNIDTRGRSASIMSRRDSIVSGYGSADESLEAPVPKRAKLVRADFPDKSSMNIERLERQSGSLRVAASTAASVRIHRPTPVNPAALTQAANDDSNDPSVRPPTPIPTSNNPSIRRNQPAKSSLRRESSYNDQSALPPMFDEGRLAETAVTSPEYTRHGSIADTPFTLPSSPPVMGNMHPQTSSPILPPFPDHDSGFMSGALESALDDEMFTEANLEDMLPTAVQEPQTDVVEDAEKRTENKRAQSIRKPDRQKDDNVQKSNPQPPPPAQRATASRPTSRGNITRTAKPLAPWPPIVPASDPAGAPANAQDQSWPNDPMSDFMADLPRLQAKKGKKWGKVQARLEDCIRQGLVPPYCFNCGEIDTPTWRRVFIRVFRGTEEDAKKLSHDPGMCFWEPDEKDDDGKMISYKVFKTSLVKDGDVGYSPHILCNPCGLWLHKCKEMRPENRWHKGVQKKPRKKPPSENNKKGDDGKTCNEDDKEKVAKKRKLKTVPCEGAAASTRSRTNSGATPSAFSPAATDASSPAADDVPDNGEHDDENNAKDKQSQDGSPDGQSNKAVSPTSPNKREGGLGEDEAREALRRAIQSSPARNMSARKMAFSSEPGLTPKPVRRSLFPSASKSKGDDAMRTLSDALINGIRRTPPSSSKTPKSGKTSTTKENVAPTPIHNDGLDDLFGTGADGYVDIPFPASPTPKQNNRRRMLGKEASIGSEQDKAKSSPPSPISRRREAMRKATPSSTPRSRRSAEQGREGDSPTPRNFETIDGLLLDIFESEGESASQSDSFYPFIPPKCPRTGSWADWGPEDYVSPRDIRDQGNDQDSTLDNNANKATPKHQTSPNKNFPDGFFDSPFANQAFDDPQLRSIIFGDSSSIHDDSHDQVPPASGEGMFDPSLIDPMLLEMGSKAADLPQPASSSNVE